jgi:hypothetical protein
MKFDKIYCSYKTSLLFYAIRKLECLPAGSQIFLGIVIRHSTKIGCVHQPNQKKMSREKALAYFQHHRRSQRKVYSTDTRFEVALTGMLL